jgi:hypothetical protein
MAIHSTAADKSSKPDKFKPSVSRPAPAVPHPDFFAVFGSVKPGRLCR